jgi:hypothetical protein
MGVNMRQELFQKVLAAAEKELAAFKNAIAKYRLRVYHRTLYGERHVTEAHLEDLEKRIEEYRALPESRGYFASRQTTLSG